MFKNKKILFIIPVISFLVFAGFGCKGVSEEKQAASRAVSLEYWTVYDDVDALNDEIVKYRANRPYLKVNIKQLRSDELYSRLVEALAEDNGPDIISVHTRDLRLMQSKLDPMPAKYNDTIVKNQKNIVGQLETIINTTQVVLPTAYQIDREYVQTVKKDIILDGKIYGLPLSLDTMAIYYNKDLLDRAQIAEPPTTWEEFQDAVRKITKFNTAEGRIIQSGTALGSANNIAGVDDILYILFKQSNIDFISNNQRAVFNVLQKNTRASEMPAISVMNFYTDFANATRDTYSWNEGLDNSLESFVQGKVAFFFGYNYHRNQIIARAPQLNFEALPMIQLDFENPVNVANYWVQSVVKKSKHKNEAWGLINYLTRSKAVENYLDASGRPAAKRSLINKQKEDVDLFPFASQLLIADNWYRGQNYSIANQALKEMIVEWTSVPPQYENQIDRWNQEVLNRAASKINQTLR